MTTGTDQEPRAGLARRLAAAFYDSLLIIALLFFATALALPLAGGRAIEPGSVPYVLYLLGVSFAFVGWFWTHGGQTLGMRAWRLRVRDRAGGTLTWRQALVRFAVGVPSWWGFGLGILWVLVDRDRMAWHDRASGTVLVLAPREPPPPKGG